MKRKQRIVGIIPARYQSTRFEGKPLAMILGKPMIQHVYKQSLKCKLLDEVIVATDDDRIVKCVNGFGGLAMLTKTDHPTGTDRVAEVAKKIKADIIVNIQGDEPLIVPEMINSLIKPLLADPSVYVTNSITHIKNLGDYLDSTVVKVAIDCNKDIMYLTRSPIPYPKTRQRYTVLKEIGLYSFRRNFLFKYVKMKQTPQELIEGIEFLRILENGYKVRSVMTNANPMSVDTLSDLIEVEKIMLKSSKNRK